jgi:5-hydroxyisourate hydrolase
MANPNRAPITSHVLDTTRGKAAAGVPVVLERWIGTDTWEEIRRSETNADGRVEDLMGAGIRADRGIYRLTFDTQAYFGALKLQSFYPHVKIAFEITNPDEHHHVPLLLSAYGYSTYRGT